MSEKLLEVEDLSVKYFGGNYGVKMASFSLDAQNRMVVLGKSLSGKTSLLRAIAGLETCRGKISFYKDISKKMAFSFDIKSLSSHDTVYDTLAYPLILRKEKDIDKTIKAQANKYKLLDKLYTKINKLSLSDKKVVLLARAMIRENELYLIDNPLQGIDEDLRNDIFDIFALNAQGKSVIYATDNYLEAAKFNSKIAIMTYGQLIQFDFIDVLKTKPKNRMVLENLGYNEYKTAKLINKDNNYYVQVENEYIIVKEPICDIFINKEVLLPIINNELRSDIYFDKDTDNLICKME